MKFKQLIPSISPLLGMVEDLLQVIDKGGEGVECQA